MQSRIVTLTPGSGLGRLRPHIGADRLIEVATVAELASALRDGGVRWVVIDPAPLSDPGFGAAVDAIRAAGAKTAFYADLKGFDHSRLIRAHEHLLPEVVFREMDDDWARLAMIVRRDDESVAARVLRGLGQPIRSLLERHRGRSVGLFGALPIPPDVDAFGALCGVPNGSMRADYRRVGLSSPHDMLDIARLAYAYEALGDRSITLSTVAGRHGFGTGRTLERRSNELLGLPPRKAAREFDRVEFARVLTSAAVR